MKSIHILEDLATKAFHENNNVSKIWAQKGTGDEILIQDQKHNTADKALSKKGFPHKLMENQDFTKYGQTKDNIRLVVLFILLYSIFISNQSYSC